MVINEILFHPTRRVHPLRPLDLDTPRSPRHIARALTVFNNSANSSRFAGFLQRWQMPAFRQQFVQYVLLIESGRPACTVDLREELLIWRMTDLHAHPINSVSHRSG
jgi:hypothetical protein